MPCVSILSLRFNSLPYIFVSMYILYLHVGPQILKNYLHLLNDHYQYQDQHQKPHCHSLESRFFNNRRAILYMYAFSDWHVRHVHDVGVFAQNMAIEGVVLDVGSRTTVHSTHYVKCRILRMLHIYICYTKFLRFVAINKISHWHKILAYKRHLKQ